MNIEEIAEWDPDIIRMDGYDSCIVGIVSQFGRPPIVCYDQAKVIATLMSGGMDFEEATEYFEFNMIGAYINDYTPCFLSLGRDAEEI